MSLLRFLPNAILGAWNSAQFHRAGGEERLSVIVEGAKRSFDQGQNMSIGNLEQYQEYVAANANGYGKELVREARLWALTMEKAMEAGYPLNRPMIESSESLANLGFSGSVYSMAIGFLAATWVHGPELCQAFGLKPPSKPIIFSDFED